MKNPIIEGIETAIAAHKAELKKYEAMLALYNSGATAENYNARRDGQLRRHAEARAKARRGPKVGVKRGPYKTKKKIRKAFYKKIQSPDWAEVIPKVLPKSELLALTSREVTDKLFPGNWSKTKRVMLGRTSAILSLYKRENKIVNETERDGTKAYYLKHE